MAEHKAQWSISLDCTCPNCDKDFDLLDFHRNMFEGIDPLEVDTPSTKNIEITCRDCKHEFTVDFEY